MERTVFSLLGFNIDTFDFESAIDYAKILFEEKRGGQIVTINPEMIETGLKSPFFANIINMAQLVIPDGIGVEIGLKIKGAKIKRIPGIEFSHKLLEICAQNNFSVALIGAKSEILEKAAKNLCREIKNLNIVYAQDGYFEDTRRVFDELVKNAPDFVLVALGSPKQEEFIYEFRKNFPQTLMIGVGGSFDVWSGDVQRAPEIYQKTGTEWLYRTVKEPKRFKRIFPTLPKFLLRVLLGNSK